MIYIKTFLIFEKPGSNEDESVDHFMKTITIAGNHKSIFTKRKNDIAKEKNQNYLSVNRSCGNILQEAGRKLKELSIVLSEAGNILKEDYLFLIFPGNKLKEDGSFFQEAKEKLMEDERNLKNLGNEMIFVETFRKNGEPILHFGLRISDCGMGEPVFDFGFRIWDPFRIADSPQYPGFLNFAIHNPQSAVRNLFKRRSPDRRPGTYRSCRCMVFLKKGY